MFWASRRQKRSLKKFFLVKFVYRNSDGMSMSQLMYKDGGTWIKGLGNRPYVSMPRSAVEQKGVQLSLHRFSDKAVCAAVYVVGTYCYGRKSQHLLVSKARVAPKHLSTPGLELVAA